MVDIKPMYERIFVTKEVKEKSDGGIFIKDDVNGNIFTVSNPGTSSVVKLGDRIVVDLRGIRELKVDDVKFVSIEEKNILAIIEEE